MKISTLILSALGFFIGAQPSAVLAANTPAAASYAEVAHQRAVKIVSALKLNDPAQTARVEETVARQYRDLNAIQSERDRKIAETKKLPDQAAAKTAITSARTAADAAVQALHADYLGRLAADLSPTQIDQVKDGMTYGVLPLTFRVYQQMLPNLTSAQKQQILAWLTEAREHAIDGGTSKEKYAWFGKYKGRINNYLSAAGIDMKAAEKNLSKPKAKS